MPKTDRPRLTLEHPRRSLEVLGTSMYGLLRTVIAAVDAWRGERRDWRAGSRW